MAKSDYAFTGALAVSFYGVPRTTTDVDVIIAVANKPDSKKEITVALNEAGLQVDEGKLRALLPQVIILQHSEAKRRHSPLTL